MWGEDVLLLSLSGEKGWVNVIDRIEVVSSKVR